MRQNERCPLNRRRFLQSTAIAAGGVMAMPSIIPSSALGAGERASPSNRIVMGAIGVGGRGSGDMRWLLGQQEVQFVAVCDVRGSRLAAAKNTVDKTYGNTDCKGYRDMRRLLQDHPDIDAMLIATGDRWHAPAAMLAMQAGKDVYCEKPGTLTIAEGRKLVDVASRYGRVFQTGTQRLSEQKFVFADELARTGRLGELKTVRAHLWPRVKDVTHNAWLPEQPLPPREEVDWDAWLGPVPWRPFNHSYLGGCGAWGVYWDLAAGLAGWGSHTIVQCQFAAGTERTSPVEYAFPGNKSGDGLVATFANGVKLVMQFDGGWRGTCGVRYEGTEGWTSVADGYSRPDVSNPALLNEYDRILGAYQSASGRSFNHLRDFLDCVRSRRAPIADPEVMQRSMTVNHAMNICLYLGRDLKWDPDKEEFVNDAEANRMRSRAVREPWVV